MSLEILDGVRTISLDSTNTLALAAVLLLLGYLLKIESLL